MIKGRKMNEKKDFWRRINGRNTNEMAGGLGDWQVGGYGSISASREELDGRGERAGWWTGIFFIFFRFLETFHVPN
jgi:hypothetical protein